MGIEFVREPHVKLQEYARVPIAFTVTERLDLNAIPMLRPRRVAAGYTKDYDGIPDNHPTDWPKRFDLAHWWFAAAIDDGDRIGGAAVILGTPAESAQTPAILWDLRVHPEHRRRTIGTQLLSRIESAARSRGHRRMRVETQDINVAANRFYAGAGYQLVEINRGAYPRFADEVQLIWQKELSPITAQST